MATRPERTALAGAGAGPAPPQHFGDYELLGEVARGGMGVVYRARQISLDRIVALKMILAGKLADETDVHRFQTEAGAAARLRHPNVVAVFEVGVIDGQHFFSMEYIEGESMSQKLARGPLPGRLAAKYVRSIARAVHYAHRQGILHRDLKPSNILIDADDEPHVTDFGLAKRLDIDSGQTRSGTVMGTPSYMAPEQASGKTRETGPASDVYSLGAILYELLTGRPPFRAESPLETVQQVLNNDPVPPTLLNPNVDKDLETICLKCLQKEAATRYATAHELSEDLRRYLDGETISARSLNMFDFLTRMLGRSQHVFAFRTWSAMLLVMAAVIAVEHLLVFFLIRYDQPRPLITAARFIQFVLLAVLFLWHRGVRLLPTTAPERELWSIWIGYILCYFVTILVTRGMVGRLDVIEPGGSAPKLIVELLPYPYIALLSGLAFFAMGSNYWGRCYAIGLAFFVAAGLMSLNLEWAPLLFGLLWAGALTSLGLHLRTLSGQAEGDKTQPPETTARTK